MSAEGAVEAKTDGAEAVTEAGAEAKAEAEAEVLVVTDGVVDGTDAGNTHDVKRKKFRPLKSIRKILGIKKGRKKSGDDPALLSAKPVSKSTGALLQVVETDQEEDVSNKALASRSMSADSVFSPGNVQAKPLEKGDMAASVDHLPSQNFQSELSAKLKSRRSEDGASSDECLPRSPDTIVTMADVINEHSTQNGMKRHSEESLESVGDEPGIAMAPDQLGQREKHQARQGTSVSADLGSTGDVDLDAIPASPTHLSNQAAKHKLSVAPKLRKASSRTRGVGKSPSTTPDIPKMSENHRTADSPEPPVTPADTEPPPKPPRTGNYNSPRTSVSQDETENGDPPAVVSPVTETVDITITVADTGDTPTALTPKTDDTPTSEAPVLGAGGTPVAVIPEKLTGDIPVVESLGTESGDTTPKAEAPDITAAVAPASEMPGAAAVDASTAAELGNKMADTPTDMASTSTVEADGTETAIAPGSTTAVAPDSTTAVAPDNITAVAPGSTTAVVPGSTTPVAPDSTTAIAPGSTTAVAPGSTTAVAPGSTTAVVPGSTTPVAPDSTTAVAPDSTTAVAPDNITAGIQITAAADVEASDTTAATAPSTDSEANFTPAADHLQEPSDLVGHQTESDEVVKTAATENEVPPVAVAPDSPADTAAAEPVPTQSVLCEEEVQMSPEPTSDQVAQDAFVPTLTPTREEGPLLEEQVVEFCPPVEIEASVEMPVVASHEGPVASTDASSVEVVEDSLGKSEEAGQNDEGVVEDEAGGGQEEEAAEDSGASSSGAAGSADMATDEDTGEAIAQRLLAVVAQQERTAVGGGEEPTADSPPPSDLPDQPTPASPGAEDGQEPPDDDELITPKSPTRGPPDPLGAQLVEEMKRKQSVKKQDSFEEEVPPPEEPEQGEETVAAENEVAPAEEPDPTPDLDLETSQPEEQHEDALQEDSHGAVQQPEEEEEEEAEEDYEQPEKDLPETPQETTSSEDEAPPAEEEPPEEEEEPEKETEKQNGPVEDETAPSEEEQKEEQQVVAEPKNEPVRPKRLSVAETRQMFAKSEPPPSPETETITRPKLKPVPPKAEPTPSSSQPTKPASAAPKETIVVKKPSAPVMPTPLSPTATVRSLADKPQPKKVFGAIKALEDQGDDKVPAWVRIAQKKQKEREGKDEDDTVGGKKVVVVEKTGSVTAKPSASRPSVSGPSKPFSKPADPPTPVIIPAAKSPAEQPKPPKSPSKQAESKPTGSMSPPPAKSGDMMANNNKLNRAGQFLSRQQKKNFILPKPEKCIVCNENVYQTEMVKSDGRFFHKKCQRCLVCKRTLDISSFMVIQEKIYCKQHGQEVKLAQQAV
ncbi:PREDICTED: uncharacterized protein LOC109467803 isoform X2 [Branchiostoma belcheri]|uniref:Uncharacterized protein LOC109467803 isoform X2 n=1 Tax=Branchiostoma belcheri TaxID=7741 RepID=A0A6P4XXP9_BRABE|nr:PREDICTED: uncharacterized protein LOC109467803 isoform X2 [Branchiostoma belcheri]